MNKAIRVRARDSDSDRVKKGDKKEEEKETREV